MPCSAAFAIPYSDKGVSVIAHKGAQGPAGKNSLESGNQPISFGLGHQDFRIGRVGFDLVPQAVNMGFDGVSGDVRVIAPDFVGGLGRPLEQRPLHAHEVW